MYHTEDVGKAITLIVPNKEYEDKLWQLPLEERKKYRKKAVIVVQKEQSYDNCKK